MRKPAGKGVREIAAETGFNISTVSRALNNRPGVSAQAAAEIIRAARKIGWKNGKTTAYAVLLPGSRVALAWYTLNMLDAIRDEALRRGVLLEIFFADHAELLRERAVDGILSLDFSSQIVRKLSTVLPAVCLNDFSWRIGDIYSVCSNAGQGVRRAVSLLLSYGHRKIGMLVNGSRETESNRERAEAFETCIASCALDPASSVQSRSVSPAGGGNPYLFGDMRRLVETGVTAVINCGESESVEALTALRLCGLRVPQDISLICWEVPRFSKYLEPPLTTVQQNFEVLAREAFDMLERLRRGEAVSSDVLVDCLLHERGSVAIPAYK